MSWYLFTAADVLAQFNDSETAAFDAAKGDTSGADLPQIVTAVIAEIGQAWAMAGLAPDPGGNSATIPPGMLNQAVALARWRYLLALPAGKALQSDERKASYNDAKDYLQKLSQRQIKPPGGAALARRGQPMQDFNTLGGTRGGHRFDWPGY